MELKRSLVAVVKHLKVNFTLKSSTLSADEMFSEVGLLPGLAKRAEQLSSLCFGYGMGMNIEDDEGSLLGIKVAFDEFTPNVIRILCIVDVLMEFVKTSPGATEVALDDLMYD
jgi:intracellular multiplication protein IcmS